MSQLVAPVPGVQGYLLTLKSYLENDWHEFCVSRQIQFLEDHAKLSADCSWIISYLNFFSQKINFATFKVKWIKIFLNVIKNLFWNVFFLISGDLTRLLPGQRVIWQGQETCGVILQRYWLPLKFPRIHSSNDWIRWKSSQLPVLQIERIFT